ncbi:MAG TPA: hypothetical protein VKD72_06510 [Gemmataceae bacterium]|nr:hypothetical protein [Gemmataceae bacterium]
MVPKSRLARILGLAVAATLLSVPARAADINRYLPVDTETVVTFNIRQILGSQLAKKNGLEQLRDLIKSQEEVDAVLKDLGLDPLKDIDKIIVAAPATGEQDKGLVIVHGSFKLDKFKTRAEKAAKDNKDTFKIHKVKDGQGGEHTVYEIAVSAQGNSQTFFAGFADRTTLLAAPAKDYLIDGLKVKDATKVKLKNQAFQDLLAKADDQQSLSIATTGEALTKSQLAEPIKEFLPKINAVVGGITFTDGIKMEFAVATKKPVDAKQIQEGIEKGLGTAKILLNLAAMNMKELAPVVGIVESIKINTKEATVTIKGEVSGETLNKLIPKDQ